MIGLQISESVYLQLSSCGANKCTLCDGPKDPACDVSQIQHKCTEKELSCTILKEQDGPVTANCGRDACETNGGHYKSDDRVFHAVESMYLVIRNKAFLYYGQAQVCIHSYWNTFYKSLGKAAVDYFIVYCYYREKNWIVRLDTSYGADFQVHLLYYKLSTPTLR